ncbi:MAG: hypothetical protein GXO82_09735, partial [Chlorobi bacterium]|nr:hypothetical protein [Chlorobiota bacterium]
MRSIRNIAIISFLAVIPAALVFAQELTPEIKQKVIDEYFRTRTLWDVLSTHYNSVIYIFIGLVLATIWLVRKYIKHASKAETRLLNALSKDALMIFDARGDLKQLNRAARLLLGLDEFVSMQFDYKYYFKMAPSPEIQDTFEEMLRTHHQVEREIVFNQGKLLRTIVCKGQPVYQESRKLEGYVFLIQDITQAIENDRRINWTGVAQHVAHKAKTPLSTITLTAQHLDLLVQDLKLDKQPQISKYLDRIVAESKKLNGIVHSLTRLAHREQYNCQPYDINTLLENIADEYRAKASSNIEII